MTNRLKCGIIHNSNWGIVFSCYKEIIINNILNMETYILYLE
nr:MAG TPA: hypothetical protein [Caudoviricetes sp.]